MIAQSSTVQAPRLLESSGWLDDILIRICIALQLTPTQYEDAKTHYQAVAKWLAAEGSPLSAISQEIFPQGSLRIGTTVRPWWQEEYDLDLVLWLSLWNEIDPLILLNLVEQRLRGHGTYAPMVERKNRCIRLNFANQFHLDILPARPDARFGGTHALVPDRAARCWKESNPKGYALWFEERGALMSQFRIMEKRATVQPLPIPEEAADKNSLQLAVQLLKRWRDIHFNGAPELAPISIVLTTLAGTYYSGEPHPLLALRSIVHSINGAIPLVGRLKVCNPANPFEDLSERWDSEPKAYTAFVSAVQDLERRIIDLESARGIADGAKRFEALFGERVVKDAVERQARAFEEVRRSSSLGVTRTGALTAAPAIISTPVRTNTFYGD
jgi:hypothetical protein